MTISNNEELLNQLKTDMWNHLQGIMLGVVVRDYLNRLDDSDQAKKLVDDVISSWKQHADSNYKVGLESIGLKDDYEALLESLEVRVKKFVNYDKL